MMIMYDNDDNNNNAIDYCDDNNDMMYWIFKVLSN